MPTSFERDHRRELLIFDTGAIRELVLFYAVEHLKWEQRRSDLLFIKDEGSYKRCGQFIASFRRKTTSASVVAELNYWIRKPDPRSQEQEKLWNRVYEEFREMGMDEEVVKLLDMNVGLVVRFGPVDVSLIELARRHAKQNPCVLTLDHALQGECKKAGLEVSLVQEVTLMLR